MAKAKFKVCVVDGDDAYSETLVRSFKAAGIDASCFSTAQAFLVGFEPSGTGCIILEMDVAGMSGLELLRILQTRKTPVPVIFLSKHATVEMAADAMKAGAEDVLRKPVEFASLLDRVKAPFHLCTRWQKIEQERKLIGEYMAQLTPRELEVMESMTAGMKNKEIARHLGISMKTLDIHRTKVMEKMHARTWSDLVRWRYLYESGIGGVVVIKPGGYLF
jgi:FixJ family two-component response regulator